MRLPVRGRRCSLIGFAMRQHWTLGIGILALIIGLSVFSGARQSSPADCHDRFTVGPTTAMPELVTPGTTDAVVTRVCSRNAASDILVDVEIYDLNAQQITQNVFGGQGFAAGETKIYSWDYTVPA